MNRAPALSNPHIVSIQWCSEARGHSMVGAGVHSLCTPQTVFSTLGHTGRAQFSPPWLHPLPSLPTHPPTTALSSTGWKVIIPAELVVPWLGLEVERRGLHPKSFLPLCLHHPNLFILPSLCTNALLVRSMISPLLSCNPHSFGLDLIVSVSSEHEKENCREAGGALPGAFSGFHLRLQSDFPFMYYRRA